MTMQPLSPEALTYKTKPASQYTFDQLASIYNDGRVDYIVPMPMNGRRMKEYVRHYDVDLDLSVVAFNGRHTAGLGMLGVRGERAWATRLGVIPARRGHGLGQFIMETLLDRARGHGARQVQLEVIRGNEPAYRLFLKLGFVETRGLLVLRRPPGTPDIATPSGVVTPLHDDEILARLAKREPGASWLDETPSLVNMGSLQGLSVKLASGASGWIVCRWTTLQLSHLVLGTPPDARHEVALALLHALHTRYPSLDTKFENLPVESPLTSAFYALGYREVFSRIEMTLDFQ